MYDESVKFSLAMFDTYTHLIDLIDLIDLLDVLDTLLTIQFLYLHHKHNKPIEPFVLFYRLSYTTIYQIHSCKDTFIGNVHHIVPYKY